MMKKPLFSIIIPAYNAEATLRRCVDSILVQTIRDFELILVDDGSSDSSGSICDQYTLVDSRIHVFHKRNGGVSSARNIGLNNAIGHWIAFCDADDYVYPQWLEHFNENISDNIQLIVQGFETDRPIGDKTATTKYGIDFHGDAKAGLKSLDSRNILGYLFSKAFKRSIIETSNIRFDESLHFCEDLIFISDYFLNISHIASTSKIGYYYSVPNWSGKYISSSTNLQTYFRYAEKSLQKGNSEMFNLYVHCCTEGLFDTYLSGNPDRQSYLKCYAKLADSYRRQTIVKIKHPMFDKLKWILMFDRLLFSSLVLDIIAYFKRS